MSSCAVVREGPAPGTLWRRMQAVARAAYAGDPCYRPSRDAIARRLCDRTSAFCAAAQVEPFVVEEDGEPKAAAVHIVADGLRDTLQVAFFEATRDAHRAFALLLAHSRETARRLGCRRIVFGLDGHVNYGLGLLAHALDGVSCFGSGYNAPWYCDLIRPHAAREHAFVAYEAPVRQFSLERHARAVGRAQARFTLRAMRRSRFRQEIAQYTRLNNEIFVGHPFYFARREEEDFELFSLMKPLLRPENLLFVERAGKTVGFLLWYPDFHEFARPGRAPGAGAWVRAKVLGQRPRRMRLAEIGILPGFRSAGAALALLAALYTRALAGRHERCETGWIAAANLRSRGLPEHFGAPQARTYCVFEVDVP